MEEVNNHTLKGNGYGGYKLEVGIKPLHKNLKEETASEIDVDSPAATANLYADRTNLIVQFTNPEQSNTSKIIWY